MSQARASPRKSRRRRGLLGAAALLLALVVLAVVFRTEIATRAAVAWLESRGIVVQSLEIAALTPDAIELRNVTLGERRELTAARIVLEPRFDGFAVSVARARIEGLNLTLDATGEQPLLGSLQPALEELAAGGGDDGAAVLPRVTIADGALLFETSAGPLAATLDGDVTADGGQLALRLPGEAERIALTASGRRVAGEAIAFTVEGELRTAGKLAGLLALPGPKVTAGTLVIEAEGRATPAGGALSLRGDAVLAGVALADGSEGLSAHLPLTIEIADGRALLTLREDAAARLERPSPDSLRDLGVPADLLPLLASGLNLTLAAGGDLPFRVATSPPWPPQQAEIAVAAQAASDQGLRLSVRSDGKAAFDDDLALSSFAGSLAIRAEAARLSLGGREARELALSLPLQADYGDAGLSLALAQPGSLRIARFGAGTPLQLQAPLAFEIDTLTLTAEPGATGYRYSLGTREDGAAFSLATAAAGPIAVTAGALTAKLDGSFDRQAGHAASLTARLGGLALPDHGFAAEAAEVAVTLDSALRPTESRFALGPFQLGPFQPGGDPPLTAPLQLDGSLKRAGKGYDIAGTLSLSGGQALADLSGRYGDDGAASLDSASRLVAFSRNGLQPAELSPALAGLTEVSGTLAANARLAWPRAPDRESGRVTLGNLSFTSGAAEVEGLDLTLELDSLLPLASAAGQRLTIRRLTAGVPVEAIELIFSLDQAPSPQLNLEDGSFGLGGARWRIAPTVLDPAAARNEVVLATDALDLATFFELVGVEGLSGSGTLTGSLPVVFAGGDVIVDDGMFNALGPGRLSISIPALRQALAGGGETVEAAVKALEDFHYEELSLSVAKSADNDATVKLSTLGQNPAVMDGQPFRFNINLESNLTSVLEALRQGYRLSDEALRRAWRLRE